MFSLCICPLEGGGNGAIVSGSPSEGFREVRSSTSASVRVSTGEHRGASETTRKGIAQPLKLGTSGHQLRAR